MARGKRFERNEKINSKKIFGFIALILFIAFATYMIINFKTKKEKKIESFTTISYFSVYIDEKWGIIDSNGKIIINPKYEDSLIVVDETKPVFLATINQDYENGTFKTIVLNEKNEEILKEYGYIKPVEVIEENILLFEKNVLLVKKDEKYGLIDLNGKIVLDFIYDEITALKNVKNSLLVKKEGKYGIVSSLGSFVILPEYKEIRALTNDYRDGYIVINNEGKYGVIGIDKANITDIKYDDIKSVTGNSCYSVKLDGKWHIINKSGEILLSQGVDDVVEIIVENIVVRTGNKVGVIDISGSEKISTNYKTIQHAFGDNYIVSNDNKYGVVNISNENVLPLVYSKISYRKDIGILEVENSEFETDIYNNLMEKKISGIISVVNLDKGYIKIRVNGEYKYYNLKLEEKSNKEILTNNTIYLSKKGDKYGYINKAGDVVVEYIYDDATEQNSFGYVGVKKNGLWGSIDKNGKIAQEPKYNLDEYTLINFISKYHFGKDLNLNYYSET